MIPKPDPKSLLTPLLLLGDITFFPFKLGWTKGTDLKYDATKLCGEYDLVTEIKWLPELDVAKRTETADQRSRLPIPDPSFKGKIGKTFADSTPDFPPGVTAPEGAPNVVVILLDDVGFGQPGTFGGPVPTPKIDQLAAQGLRFNRFHTTGICSPTRASLLTGRNHHTVANGTITELSTGYPGYNSILPKSAATVARILRENGYSTGMWGKNHNAPDWETHAVGPFDHWPTGMGFEYFYGVHGGETSQWEPQLYLNTTAVEPSKTAEQGYHLTEDLVDNAIEKALAMVAGKTIDTAPPAAAAVPGHVLKVGDPAPKLCPGKWLQGEPVAEFAPGTVYVVEFWATWCGPCKASIPHLNELHLKFKDQGLVVIGQDCWERNDAAAEPFVRNMAEHMTYRVAADDKSDGGKGKMANAWMSAAGRNAIPAAFIVGKQGKIVWIGHPMKLDETMLGEILADKYDMTKATAAAAREEKQAAMTPAGKLRGLQDTYTRQLAASQWEEAKVSMDEIDALAKGFNPPTIRLAYNQLRLKWFLAKKDLEGAVTFASGLMDANPREDIVPILIVNDLADCPDLKGAALDFATKLARDGYAKKGQNFNSFAAPLARLEMIQGHQDQAVELQTQAIRNISDQTPDAICTRLRADLESYQAGKLPPRPVAK